MPGSQVSYQRFIEAGEHHTLRLRTWFQMVGFCFGDHRRRSEIGRPQEKALQKTAQQEGQETGGAVRAELAAEDIDRARSRRHPEGGAGRRVAAVGRDERGGG